MRVTDKQIPMEERFVDKLDLMIKRCVQKKPKLDAVLIFDGEEGYGKTTKSIGAGYYVAYKTGRKFNEEHLFFKVEDLIKFAQSTENQIIIWDEAALGGLSQEWFNKAQINLIKLLMTARKKRHFLMINIPKFYKLKDYIIERSMGLIHTYARNDTEVGRFTYYNKKNKNRLMVQFMDKSKRNYQKFISFHGTFPDVLDKDKSYNILDTFDNKKYEDNKDKAIMGIGDEEQGLSRYKKAYLKLQYNLTILVDHLKLKKGMSCREIERLSGIPNNIISEGKENVKKYPELFNMKKPDSEIAIKSFSKGENDLNKEEEKDVPPNNTTKEQPTSS